jgi:hypothetical protein
MPALFYHPQHRLRRFRAVGLVFVEMVEPQIGFAIWTFFRKKGLCQLLRTHALGALRERNSFATALKKPLPQIAISSNAPNNTIASEPSPY